MKKIAVLGMMVIGSFGCATAQPKPGYGASLPEVNTYLGQLYASPADVYNDTDRIGYRKEALLMLKSGNKEMETNGFITLGLLDFYGHREDAAIRYFKAALARDSGCYICYNKLHWLYWYGKNNYGEANRYLKISTAKFETLVAQDSGNVETWTKLFNLYKLKEGTVPLEIQQRMRYIADKRLTFDPDNAYYWWERSFSYTDDPAAEEQALLKSVYPGTRPSGLLERPRLFLLYT